MIPQALDMFSTSCIVHPLWISPRGVLRSIKANSLGIKDTPPPFIDCVYAIQMWHNVRDIHNKVQY